MLNRTQSIFTQTTGKAEPPGLTGPFYDGCFSDYIAEETLLSKIQKNMGPAPDSNWEEGTAWFV